MSDILPTDSPLLIIPAKPMPNTRRARFAHIYKGGFAAVLLLISIWQLIQLAIIDLTYPGALPAMLQSFFTDVSFGCGMTTIIAGYLIISASTDAMLRDAFLKNNARQLEQLPVKIATMGCLWWFARDDYITYASSLLALLERIREPIIRSASENVPQPLTLQQIRILEPLKEFMLSLSDRLTLLLIGRDGTRVSITFPLESHRAAFILYLAIVGYKSRVLTRDFLQKVYFAASRSTFNADTGKRIHEIIINAALRRGLRPFKLFRLSSIRGNKGWQFAKPWSFEDIDAVYAWSSQVAAFRSWEAVPPSLEELRRLAERIMKRTSELALTPLFNHPAYERWAQDAVKELCQKRLIIVEFIAECESDAWERDPAHPKEALKKAAHCYKWCMHKAMTVMNDLSSGERYRQFCVRKLQLLGDDEGVARIDELFRKLLRELPPNVQ